MLLFTAQKIIVLLFVVCDLLEELHCHVIYCLRLYSVVVFCVRFMVRGFILLFSWLLVYCSILLCLVLVGGKEDFFSQGVN